MIGSFFMSSGRDFRHKARPHLHFKISNNVLESLAEIIAMWIGILDSEITIHAFLVVLKTPVP